MRCWAGRLGAENVGYQRTAAIEWGQREVHRRRRHRTDAANKLIRRVSPDTTGASLPCPASCRRLAAAASLPARCSWDRSPVTSTHQISVDQRTMEGSFQLNPNASPFIPGFLSSFADKNPEKAESSSKGGTSAGTSGPSEYVENDMDPLALTKMVFSMFPNISTDFIDELLKANDFDINMTVDMLHELNSQDMFHDDAEDINGLHDDQGLPGDDHHSQGLPGDDHHHAEVSKSSSNPSQDLQNAKPAKSSDVELESVLPKFSKINLLHNDLGLPDDDKSAGTTSAAK